MYISKQKCEDCVDLLLINAENKSLSKALADIVYLVRFLMKYKKICLEINGEQSVKLESGTIEFKNYFKQVAVSFKSYADFESLLKGFQINDREKNTSYTEKYQNHIPCSFAYKYKAVCIDDKFNKEAVLYRGKNAFKRFIEAILEEYDCKKVIKEHFNKNLIMSVEDEEKFQSSNKCWICKKLFSDKDKVKDHDYITGKYSGLAHSNYNINLKLMQKVLTIFHNLRGYDGHLIMQEISKFHVKISVD